LNRGFICFHRGNLPQSMSYDRFCGSQVGTSRDKISSVSVEPCKG
jgi:hypothetical protein